jgi:preprotein translocase subunit SecG
MKSTTALVGTLLIVIGIIALAYQGFTYTKHEKVAQIGDLQVTADTQKTVYFPPIFGGLFLVTGIILVIVSNKKL